MHNNLIGINGEAFELAVESFFKGIMVNNAGMNLEEKAGYFGIIVTQVICLDEDLVRAESLEKHGVVNLGCFYVCHQLQAA